MSAGRKHAAPRAVHRPAAAHPARPGGGSVDPHKGRVAARTARARPVLAEVEAERARRVEHNRRAAERRAAQLEARPAFLADPFRLEP